MPAAPFLALITPVGDAPAQPGQPPRPWGPINYPDIGFPGNQPYPDQGLPRPPLGIWGGRPPPYVDIGFPGNQPYPDQGLPGTQPGLWPSRPPYMDIGFPGPQPGRPPQIWGGPYYPPVIWDPSRPANPITNPGDPNNPGAGQPQPPQIEWKTAWSPTTGWVVVGVPTGEHVTPSAEASESGESRR